jgi:hypothetical protein
VNRAIGSGRRLWGKLPVLAVLLSLLLVVPPASAAAAAGKAPSKSAPKYSSTFHAMVRQVRFPFRAHRSSVKVRPPIRKVKPTNPTPPTRRPNLPARPGIVSPNQAGFPEGYIPCDLYNAYRLNNSGLNGASSTIVIIDAFDPTPIGSDLANFDASFGLPDPPAFDVFQESANPTPNPGWASEITLDVEWAHAMAPAANIVLLLADTNATGDLLSAVDFATTAGFNAATGLNPDVVSMSFSGPESQFGNLTAEQGADPWSPTSATGHAVTYLAATGDQGWDNFNGTHGDPPWPATDPRVVGVGGTSVAPPAFGYASPPGSHFDCSGVGTTPGVDSTNETVWGQESCTASICGGTGGGPSLFEPTPSYQTAFTSTTFRATPDVSMLADPATGVAMFENGSWIPTVVGGTSLATPLSAGIVALLDQERSMRGLAGVNVSSPTSSWVYSSPTQARDFNDITSGSDPGFLNDPCVAALLCVGKVGYDMTTGRGSLSWPNLLTDVAGTGPGALRTALTTVSPTRIMDTRSGLGVAQSQMQAGETRTLQVTGTHGVPGNAGAIVVNVGVTNTHGAGSGYVLVYPCNTSQPLASTVNWLAGQTIAILTQVALGSAGCLNVFNATGQTDVFLDLQGYFLPATVGTTTSGLYNPLLTPLRALDTRVGLNAPQAKVGPGGTLLLQVAGNSALHTSPAIPATASAVTLNLTEVNGGFSYLSAYPSPDGTTCPADLTSSNLNFPASRVLANRVTVHVGPNGTVCFYNSLGNVDVLVDLVGWYSSGNTGDTTGMTFSPVTPTRVYDSRLSEPPHPLSGTSSGACSNGNDVTIKMPPAIGGAVSMNVTALFIDTGGYLEAYPTGSPPSPPTSDINFRPGEIMPNLVIARLGTGSAVNICNALGTIQFFIDVNGGYST